VTFLTLQTADVVYCYTVSGTGFDLVVILFVNAVELVAFTIFGVELYFGSTVTVNTPAHA
jgi:hypothetical protein